MTSASSFLKGQPPAAVTRLGEACLACACITVPCLAPARPPARAGNSNTRGLSSRPRRRFCAFAGTSRCGARPGPAARPVPRTGRDIYTPTVAPSSRAGVTEREGASGHATTRHALRICARAHDRGIARDRWQRGARGLSHCLSCRAWHRERLLLILRLCGHRVLPCAVLHRTRTTSPR